METIKLNFDADILGKGKTLTLEIPYSGGVVATNRFCPVELLSGEVELLAALNGESLEEFIHDCKLQLKFANEAKEQSTLHEAFIAGLLASVMEHIARSGKLSQKEYLLHLDAFSYLVNASGISENQVITMYPNILKSIKDTIESDNAFKNPDTPADDKLTEEVNNNHNMK